MSVRDLEALFSPTVVEMIKSSEAFIPIPFLTPAFRCTNVSNWKFHLASTDTKNKLETKYTHDYTNS